MSASKGVGFVAQDFLCSQLFYHNQVQHLTETFGLQLLAQFLGEHMQIWVDSKELSTVTDKNAMTILFR